MKEVVDRRELESRRPRDGRGWGRLQEAAAVAAGGLVLAAAMKWWLLPGLATRYAISGTQADPLYQAWAVAWLGHALVEGPSRALDANIFWPYANTLAFSDMLAGLAPAGLVGRGLAAAAVRYNVLFLLAHALAFAGAYALAREVGIGRLGSVAAGAAFAFSPWRLTHASHLNVLSSGGIPLSIALLVRGWRQGRPGLLGAGWALAAWQVSVSLATGVHFAYLLLLLAGLGAARAAWVGVRKRIWPSPGMAAAAVAGAVLFAATGLLLASAHATVAREFADAQNHFQLRVVDRYSPPVDGYMTAAEHSLLWGGLTRGSRAGLFSPEEQALFPGLVAVLLAGIGAGWGNVPRWIRWALVGTAAVTGILALGTTALDGRLYTFLWEHVPGWKSSRTPSRILTLTTLSLAVLAGLGVDRLAAWSARRSPRLRTSVVVVSVAAILIEGYGVPRTATFPSPPPGLASAPTPWFAVPSGWNEDARVHFWSVATFPETVNGYSRFTPCAARRMRRLARGGTWEPVVAAARSLGVRSLVVVTGSGQGGGRAPDPSAIEAETGTEPRRGGGVLVFPLGSFPQDVDSAFELLGCPPEPVREQ